MGFTLFGSSASSRTSANTTNTTSTVTNVGINGPDLANIVGGISNIVRETNNRSYQPLTGYTGNISTPTDTANESPTTVTDSTIFGIDPMYLVIGAVILAAIFVGRKS